MSMVIGLDFTGLVRATLFYPIEYWSGYKFVGAGIKLYFCERTAAQQTNSD
jgi:hypothetical protein